MKQLSLIKLQYLFSNKILEKFHTFLKLKNHSEELIKYYFKNEIKNSKQEYKKELLRILLELEKTGVLIINDFPIFNFDNDEIKKYAFLFFIHLIGKPISHTEKKIKYLWEITPRKLKGKRIETYSENSKVADLHTDSSYKSKPEKYIAVYVKHSSKIGGKTVYLDFRKVLKNMNDTQKGNYYINILKNKKYPLIVPSLYNKENPVIYAPVLNKIPLIRFRYDTIRNGFKKKIKSKSEEKISALNYIKEKIDKSKFIKKIFLENGSIMLLNNHIMLHGRTRFIDKSRMLYRIRFN